MLVLTGSGTDLFACEGGDHLRNLRPHRIAGREHPLGALLDECQLAQVLVEHGTVDAIAQGRLTRGEQRVVDFELTVAEIGDVLIEGIDCVWHQQPADSAYLAFWLSLGHVSHLLIDCFQCGGDL